jgi:hypothetical protein
LVLERNNPTFDTSIKNRMKAFTISLAILLFVVSGTANAKCTCFANATVYNYGVPTGNAIGSFPSFTAAYQIRHGDSVAMAVHADASCNYDGFTWTRNGVPVLVQPGGGSSTYYIARDAGIYRVNFYCDIYPAGLTVTITYNDVGIEDVNSVSSIAIYPNPFAANFLLEIKGSHASHISYTIYDCLGNEIREASIEDATGDLKLTENFESMAKGVYFLRMYVGDAIFEKKLVHF